MRVRKKFVGRILLTRKRVGPCGNSAGLRSEPLCALQRACLLGYGGHDVNDILIRVRQDVLEDRLGVMLSLELTAPIDAIVEDMRIRTDQARIAKPFAEILTACVVVAAGGEVGR